MSIGTMKPVILEQWAQVKDGGGNLVDSITHRYKIWADVEKVNGSRVYDSQTKMEDGYRFRVWNRVAFDVDVLWKLVYDGKRLTVQSIEKENEKEFWWIIKADSNGRK